MSIFEKPTPYGCEKPDCYFCWLRGRAYTTTPLETIATQPTLKTKVPEDILIAVCKITGVDPAAVKSPSRNHKIIAARHMYCIIADELTNAGFIKIGKA